MWSSDPLIEIAGAWLPNKGAELMAHATISALSRRIPGVRFCSAKQGNDQVRAAIGMPVLRPPKSVKWLKKRRERFPAELQRTILRLERRAATHVIDVSGFAYGDYWGAIKAQSRAGMYVWLGKPIYLVPQSFGPFTDEVLRREMRGILNDARVIAARDRLSLEYLETLECNRDIAVLPDITFGLDVSDRAVSAPDKPYACLVLNAMTVKSGALDQDTLLAIYRDLARVIRDAGIEPVIVLHEPVADRTMSQALAEACDHPPIVELDDARDIKAFIGGSECVVTGRYHGLVNGLAAGVPSFAVGWSYKYKELLNEFECPEALFDGDPDRFVGTIEVFLSRPSAREERRAKLTRISLRNKALIEEFWDRTADDIRR